MLTPLNFGSICTKIKSAPNLNAEKLRVKFGFDSHIIFQASSSTKIGNVQTN